MDPTLRQLRAFQAGATHSSFSAAAAKLGITQPGFSLLIRQLEAELGLKLFDRTTRSVALTRAGRDLAGRVGRILKGLEEIYRDVRDLNDRRQGHVTIGVMPSVAASVVPTVLAEINQTYPGITVTLREDHAAPLMEHVVSGDLDFAVGVELGGHDLIRFKPLLRDQLFGVFYKHDPILKASSLTWTQLKNHPYISIFGQSSVHGLVERCLTSAHSSLRQVYEIQYLLTALSLVRCRIGFTIMPELALEDILLDGLVKKQITDPVGYRTIGIITHKRKSQSAASDALTKELIKAAQRAVPQRYRLPKG